MIKMKNKLEDEYYTIKEVAKMLKVAYITVYRWIQDGRLTAVKAGKQYRISRDSLSTFLSTYKQ